MTEQDAANVPLAQTRAIRAYATAINKRDSAWKRLREYRSMIEHAYGATRSWSGASVDEAAISSTPPPLPTVEDMRQALRDLEDAAREIRQAHVDMQTAGVPHTAWSGPR